jgi:hypothetical protein
VADISTLDWLRYDRRLRFVFGVAALVADAFNRADNAASLLVADTGQAWTALLGTWGTIGSQAYQPSATSQGVAVCDAGRADGAVNVTFAVGPATTSMWLVFRAADGSNYLLVTAQTPTTVEMFKNVAGGFTQIGTAAHAWAGGEVVKAQFSGSALVVAINGANVISATETAGLANTRCGIGMGNGPSAAARFDNFAVTP